MRILLISPTLSGLIQRYYTELEDAGNLVSVELHQGDNKQLMKGVSLFKPDLIICPYLAKRIPKQIYLKYTCLIVHPDIKGNRGPSSLDWAINWQQHTTENILKRIRAADGSPEVLDEVEGRPVHLYNAHRAESLIGQPGKIIAFANGPNSLTSWTIIWQFLRSLNDLKDLGGYPRTD